ncbi:hypothetical protein LTR08_004940 [Meristemomyces frigidus]|nr:hypothetical protein LTR08_004940 [Meristemomyces frigidus]
MFAAHWSFFLPNGLPYDPVSRRHEEPKIGRRIHVSGDRLNGFQFKIIRHYDVSKHRSVGARRFAIGCIPVQNLQHATVDDGDRVGLARKKDDDEGGGFIDNEPVDEFEKICTEVKAPGPSLNRVVNGDVGTATKGRRKQAEAQDCQWWIRQVVEMLVSKGVLKAKPAEAGEDAIRGPSELAAALPVH